MDTQTDIPLTHPQISTLISINKAGFGITSLSRHTLFNCTDRITTQVFDIDTCGFKFSASSSPSRIITNITNNAIGMIFDACTGKASGLQFIGQNRNGTGIEARRGSRITLSGDCVVNNLDIGMRAQHDSSIFIDSSTIENCYQGLREEGGKIRYIPSKTTFLNNGTNKIFIPVEI